MTIGTIGGLYRYPVKSLLGEQCQEFAVTPRGIEGDRLYALINRDGKIGSHKNTRRFREMANLFSLAADIQHGETFVSFSDGRRLAVTDCALPVRLSEVVGQPVTVAAETDVSYFDAGPIHIVTSASIAWLQQLLPGSNLDPRRFRPNLVVDCPGVERIERGWVGRRIRIDTVELEIVAETERCAMTTAAQLDLPRDPHILTSIGRQAGLMFGVYAKVIRAGSITMGGQVEFAD